jgi:cytochrome d ubiquinol oxidase subunit I
MHFNPDTARNEMLNFWDVLFSPVAIYKFLHTVSSGYVTASVFVLGISAWFLLKNRETMMAKRSILVSSIFGLTTSLFLAFTGDGSAYTVAQKQPMKLAAMEGLYKGQKNAGLMVIGALDPSKEIGDDRNGYVFKVEIPRLLSFLSYRNASAYVPGIDDLVAGGYKPEFNNINPMEKEKAFSAEEKIARGKIAINALASYKNAKNANDNLGIQKADSTLKANFPYFGYGYLSSSLDIIPNIPVTFYSFRIMVFLGFYFILLFILVLHQTYKNNLEKKRWLLWLSLWTIPLVYLASQAGWIVAEVGRQPWVIQDLLPTVAAVSMIDATSVKITFWLFAALFTALLIAEIMIMTKQIKIGPKDGGTK